MRGRLQSLPRGLVACILVAVVNAVAWAAITPPYQVPDEPVHFGYAQYLAETGKLPVPVPVATFNEELDVAQQVIPFSTEQDPNWLGTRSDRNLRVLEQPRPRVEPFSAGYVAGNPPLYYALQVPAYRLTSSATVVERLLAMRLVSALMAGALVGFVFLFLRELLPGRPLLWRVGALGVALHPVVAFIGGGVNPDILLWVLCAALFYGLARAFRRGLDVPTGTGIGLAVLAALLTKLAMLTVVPGVVVALGLAVAGTPRAERRRALAGAAAAVAATLIPFAILAGVLDRAPSPAVADPSPPGGGTNLREGLSYLWQFYLPKLPFMTEQFPDYPGYALWETYIKGFVGRFGWFQFQFPVWASAVGLAVLVGIALAAGVTLARSRAVTGGRRLELLAYASIAVSTALLLNAFGYRYRETMFGFNFEQTRYLFPLLPLYAAVLALAVGASGRYRAAAAALLVTIAAGHNLFGQAVTLGRYFT